ncbi:MAG: GAF domain-containing protein, partial [Deltaproteobacteria bacterium]|nr:GAF domain-containing protein [Deltaproteobacteria bacterium]
MLKNEISGETRLRRAFDEVDRATRAEAALAAQHATLRGIIEGTASPIFSVDREYRYVAFNRTHASVMRALYGAEIEVGRSILDYQTVAADREKAREHLDRALAGERLVEEAYSGEEPKLRRCFEVSHHPVRNDDDEVIGVAVFADDITERKRSEDRLQKEAERGSLLLDIFIRSPQMSERQVYDEVLELAVRLTDSTIGFLHRVSDDQKTVCLTTWRRAALESCAAGFDTHYPIERAGDWVDCVRLGHPVIYNDLAASPHQKGLPLGDAALRRFMSVPVIEGDKVRIIFGVGNKAAEYVDDDAFQVQQIANELQKVVSQRRAAERVESLGRLYRTISEMNQVLVREKNRDRLFAEVCRICVEHGEFAMAWAGLVDLSTGTVQPLASAGVEAGYVDELSVRLDVPPADLRPAARAVLADRVVVVDDTETDETFVPWREAARLRGFRSCAAFPVRADGEVRGLLKVYACEAGVFHGEVAALFAELGADLGYALHALETEERRTQAEQELQRSRNSLEEAQRIAHIGNWDLDLESDVLSWSDEIYRIFEIDPARFGASYDAFLDTIHPEDRAFVDGAYTESVRTKSPYDIVHRLVMADGRVKYVNERCETFYGEDGRPLRSIGTVQDVTERKRAEDEVFEAQRVFRTLVESSPDIVARYDRECRRTYVNPRYLEVAQIPRQDLLGAAPVQRSPLPEASAAILQSLLLKVLESGIAEALDVVWPKADGVDSWYNIYAFPELDREGRVESVMTISRDITDRKRAERELARVNRALRVLSDSNAALVRMTEEGALLNEVCRIAVHVGSSRMAWVGYVEHDEERTVRPVARSGESSGYVESARVTWADNERGRGPGGTAIRTGRPSVFRALPTDAAFA